MASILVSVAVDRIGKRRSVIIGVSGMVAGFGLLPFLNRSIFFALVSIVIHRTSFEFAIVSNFPLLSEQVPEQRGKVMSLSMSFALIGSTIASITGPAAYLRFRVWGLGPVSFTASVAALLLLLFLVREQPHGSYHVSK